jgi:alkylhydroperoxidase family enzyme
VKALGNDDATVKAILDDWRSAPIDGRLRAMLLFLETMTRAPADLGPPDAEALRAAGVDAASARDAIYVAFLFGIMARLADAFAFELSDERALRWVARILLKGGYGGASLRG